MGVWMYDGEVRNEELAKRREEWPCRIGWVFASQTKVDELGHGMEESVRSSRGEEQYNM